MNTNEIVRALRCSGNENAQCKTCKYAVPYKDLVGLEGHLDYCDDDDLQRDAADLIESQQADIAAKDKHIEWTAETIPALSKQVRDLQADLAAANRRAEAAEADLAKWKICGTCKHFSRKRCLLNIHGPNDGNCAGCRKWQWRGPQDGSVEGVDDGTPNVKEVSMTNADDQRIAEITRIMNTVERTRAKLQSENQCYTCALGSHDECGDYCEKAADDYECEDEGCSNFKDGTPSYAKIDEDDLGTLFDYIPYLLSQLAAKDAEIERLREAQRWIPVSERLPKEDGWYECTVEIVRQQRYVMSLFWYNDRKKFIDNIRQNVVDVYEVRGISGERLRDIGQDRTEGVVAWKPKAAAYMDGFVIPPLPAAIEEGDEK